MFYISFLLTDLLFAMFQHQELLCPGGILARSTKGACVDGSLTATKAGIEHVHVGQDHDVTAAVWPHDLYLVEARAARPQQP